MFNFTKYSTIYYIFSGILIIASIVSLIVFGLNFGIEFTGGSTMEIEFIGERPNNEQIREQFQSFGLNEVVIQPIGSKGMILKFKGIDEIVHEKLVSELSILSELEEKNFQFIGPSIGEELKNKTTLSVFLVLFAITLYITFVFRKVSKPVSSWKYGITSLIALFHDILIPLGVFSVLGRFYNVEITIPIVAALLTVIGFSVHDTIVIFDRIRENIGKMGGELFNETVDLSLNQTLGRSINTTLTTLFVMLTIFFFGGQTLKYFSLALIIGITSGAYSSIFIAGPLLVTWKSFSERRFKN